MKAGLLQTLRSLVPITALKFSIGLKETIFNFWFKSKVPRHALLEGAMCCGDDPAPLDEASPTKVTPAAVDGDLKGDLIRSFPRIHFPAVHYPVKTLSLGSI